MATKVSFYIRGLCLCFLYPLDNRGDDCWHIAFICDDEHGLSLDAPGLDNPKPLHEIGSGDRQLRLVALDGKFEDTYTDRGDSYKQIFNVSSKQLHGKSAWGRSHLRFMRRNDLPPAVLDRTDLIWMAVPNSIINASKLNKHFYWVDEVDAGGGNPRRTPDINQYLACEIKISFTVSNGLEIRWEDSQELIHKVVGGVNEIDVDFNNVCGGRCNFNDFREIYGIVIDNKEGSERQFLSGKYPKHVQVLDGESIDELRNAMGNCDPLISDPPPEGDWPPLPGNLLGGID